MRFTCRFRSALSAIAIALLAACSAGNSQLGPTSSTPNQGAWPLQGLRSSPWSLLRSYSKFDTKRPDWMKAPPPNAPSGEVLASEFSAGQVRSIRHDTEPNQRARKCETGTQINAIGVDPSNNLWIPSAYGGSSGVVSEYGPHCGAPGVAIPISNGPPTDVTFDSKGNIYIGVAVTNTGSGAGPGYVPVYNSAGSPTGVVLTDPSIFEAFGLGTDSSNDVFVSAFDSNDVARVVEFVGGVMPGTALTGITLPLPGSPVFDASDNLIITDWSRASKINVYAPPYTSITASAPLKGRAAWCSLGHDETHLYCADFQHGSVDVYTYPFNPSGSSYLYSYTQGLHRNQGVEGVATSPAAPL